MIIYYTLLLKKITVIKKPVSNFFFACSFSICCFVCKLTVIHIPADRGKHGLVELLLFLRNRSSFILENLYIVISS